MQVNTARHCWWLRHSRVGGNLVEVPAFAGMTFLRWDDRGCWGDVSLVGGVILDGYVILDGLRHSRVGGNLVEVPAFAGMTECAGMTFLRGGDAGCGYVPGGYRLSFTRVRSSLPGLK